MFFYYVFREGFNWSFFVFDNKKCGSSDLRNCSHKDQSSSNSWKLQTSQTIVIVFRLFVWEKRQLNSQWNDTQELNDNGRQAKHTQSDEKKEEKPKERDILNSWERVTSSVTSIFINKNSEKNILASLTDHVLHVLLLKKNIFLTLLFLLLYSFLFLCLFLSISCFICALYEPKWFSFKLLRK